LSARPASAESRFQDAFIRGAEVLAKSALLHATTYFDEHVNAAAGRQGVS
jgi:hypothetical protein